MSEINRCAACGKRLRKGKGIKVKVWDDEDVESRVCSRKCKQEYAEGPIEPSADQSLPRELKIAVGVLGLAALEDLSRAALAYWLSDPLGAVAPWLVQASSAIIWIFLAVGVIRGRPMARVAALVIAGITAMAHFAAMSGSGELKVLLVPVSVTVPLLLLLLGKPGNARIALACSTALLLPAFMIWQAGIQVSEQLESQARIDEVTLPGSTATSGELGITMRLADGWRALEPENGIVDWPHSEFEIIHPRSGAAGFVVLNPDCDREVMPVFQEKSLNALAETGGDPIPVGLKRVGDGVIELRVRIQRGDHLFESFDLFRELESHDEPARPGERRGCAWLHCLAPPRWEDQVRENCRQMVITIARTVP